MTQADYPTDGELVAYLDGGLAALDRAKMAQHLSVDAEARQRLSLLAEGVGPLREAFDTLLADAPKPQLDRMLAGLPRVQADRQARPTRISWSMSGSAIAAALAIFFSGIAFDRLWPLARPADEPPAVEALEPGTEWRQAVAQYLTLYTGETLAGMTNDDTMRERELDAVAAKVGVPLSLDRISLPHLDFKRAQLLEYDGKPLGQLAYLGPQNEPTFLCIMADGEPDSIQHAERRRGFNVVYWSRGGRAFMLIGPDDAGLLQSLASTLSQRISG